MINPMSYTDHGGGTVTDNVTGLIWQKEDDGIRRNWEDALAYCQDLDLGGSTNWRLPHKKELASIADDTRRNPAIDPVFTGTESFHYWSSSTNASRTDFAWIVYFGSGINSFISKPGSYHVRCTR